jgi:hypothetical protein
MLKKSKKIKQQKNSGDIEFSRIFYWLKFKIQNSKLINYLTNMC